MRRFGWLLLLVFGFAVYFAAQAGAQAVYVQDKSGTTTQPTLPSKTIMLTFDDGPSEYTPEILKILKLRGIKATFFVVGSQAIRRPILKEIYDQGHEIGNHTYSHADLASLPEWRLKLEINATRIIINSQLDRSTRLFRPPLFGTDALTPEADAMIQQLVGLGYVAVGENIDPKDWRKQGVTGIVANATNEQGGIILLHDGGGDRTQTVNALPAIIDYYQERDFTFMTVSEALNLSKEDTMPALTPPDRVLARIAGVFFGVMTWLLNVFKWFIVLMIIATFGRFLLVMISALIQSRRQLPVPLLRPLPCSVIIPAYNESAVIQSCIKSVLASRYRFFEVIVVDDGSKDNTYEMASAIHDRRLWVFRKENGGKASALNYGISKARAPFVIAIDADTIFRHKTIRNLMRHFYNPKVGAVSGNTRIVNQHKLITKLQSLEYIIGFNLDRRMGDLLDCIAVVPGAVGAFRRSALLKVGKFSFDTLAEDTDLTLSIKEAGYKIVYDEEAVALTEAPATIRDLLKQRFRWTFGTMQCVWKHKRSLFNPKRGSLGLIGLPYIVFFQILFPLVSPLFDVALLIGLLNRQYGLMLMSFGLYVVVDVITAATALKLDGEKLRKLWILIPQRIVYRQLMYYVIFRSCINVLRGRLVHWGTLKRGGTHLAKANKL
jgi:peptidoglycan-N-acetylglucosamine deacetylase